MNYEPMAYVTAYILQKLMQEDICWDNISKRVLSGIDAPWV